MQEGAIDQNTIEPPPREASSAPGVIEMLPKLLELKVETDAEGYQAEAEQEQKHAEVAGTNYFGPISEGEDTAASTISLHSAAINVFQVCEILQIEMLFIVIAMIITLF